MPESFPPDRREIKIPMGGQYLLADLSQPAHHSGIVLFAHGSGSGRRSPRNRFVAEALERSGIATLLLDLLTPEEARQDERTMSFRFQIPLLADRLIAAIDWVGQEPLLSLDRLGLYGASTGGAAALIAAARRPERIHALVLRGARSDLAGESVPLVKAPTLLVVGGWDPPILEIARETSRWLRAPHSTVIVPHATHLFEEPGALGVVSENAVTWFGRHLSFASPTREVMERRA